MKASDSVAQWARIGTIPRTISFIAKEALCFGVGCFIHFINMHTLENHQYNANFHNSNGDGAKCLRGHRSLNMFAYAERCQRPDLYVMSYPQFEVIFKIDDIGTKCLPFSQNPPLVQIQAKNNIKKRKVVQLDNVKVESLEHSAPSGRVHTEVEGYKNLSFSDTSLLFTLGDLPKYKVTVWNWRRGQKYAESKNELLYENQILRCSFGRPMYLAQLGVGSNKLLIWDVFYVCTTVLFAKHVVKMGTAKPAPFCDILWTTEGGFYVVDSRGSVFTFDGDFTIQRVIECSIDGDIPTSIVWFRNGITVGGPDYQIRHYRKSASSGDWLCESQIALEENMMKIKCNKTDKMVGITDRNRIVMFNLEKEIVYLTDEVGCYEDFCLIYPIGQFIVALSYGDLLNVFEVLTGKLVSTMKLKGHSQAITENPELPYVAVGMDTGELRLISFYNELKPSVMVSFNLTTNPITKIKFFENGRIIVAGCMDIGQFFIIEGYPGSQMQVVTHIEVDVQIKDFLLVGSQEHCYRFFVLPVTSTQHLVGNQIIRYCIVGSQIVNVKTYGFETPTALYSRIIQTTGHHRDRTFYAIPFQSRVIHILESKRGNDIMKKTKEIKTAHMLRRFDFHISTYHAVTWGSEGFVVVTDNNFEQDIGITAGHHRYNAGVRKAYADPLGQFTMALGYDGVLAVMQMPYNEIDQERKDYLYKLRHSEKFALLFVRPTLGYTPEPRFKNLTWREIQTILQIEREKEQCKAERSKILKEFRDIQVMLKDLVTKNLEGPENERIDLVEFYLDTSMYNKMQINNREECKNKEIYLKALITAQDKVSKYMIETYWEKMGVIWKILKGIFTIQQATNYCLLPENPESLKRLAWIEEQRKMEMFMTSDDTFEPWVLVSEEKLLENLSKRPHLPKEDFNHINALRKIREVEEADTNKSLETRIALAGSVALLYIPLSPGHYQQRQLVTFYQCEFQQAVVEREVIKLKQQANKVFEETMKQKEREMYNIKEKHNRLRHIVSEYNYFSEKKVYVPIIDPEWIQEENPVTITRVTDDELTMTPYVSPSEQAILDAKAAEAERIRLLLLADDFRERALMAMMNGVLEVRWEDELKKDVPKPKCMTDKEPEHYNEEDLRAIRDYEEKVITLASEREKYKSLLESEFTKLTNSIREGVRKFNQKVWECTRFKMYIDSGMNHENLQVNRARVIQSHRIEISEREKDLLQSIRSYEGLLEQQYKTIAETQSAMGQCKNNLEALQLREKVLEKAFKKEFGDMSPVVQEVASKLYKKRPKATFRNINTATVLNELAKGIMTNERTVSMTPECLEYLRSLDQLDQFVGLPPAIDEYTYGLICRYRRQRIEYEVKLRAGQLQIQDGDNTTATFQNRVQTCKEKIAELNTQVIQTREDRLRLMHNEQIQIVLRRGLVEVPLSGSIEDFEDAILVPKKEIQEVNNYIVETGNSKLAVIKMNMTFRRNIMATEWDHKFLRMQINDLIEQKTDIENVAFTKDMQNYLHSKALGRKTDADSFEWELELLTASYGKRIKDKKEKFLKIKKQLSNYKENNIQLDKAIKENNIDVCSFKLQKDYELESREPEIIQARMEAMLKRSSLVEAIQQNYNEILILQTELELLRLRTYPTFKYKFINSE